MIVYQLDKDPNIFDYFKELGYKRDSLDKQVEITEEVYWHFMEVLPPMYFTSNSFAMIEAANTFYDGVMRSYFWEDSGRWFHKHKLFDYRNEEEINEWGEPPHTEFTMVGAFDSDEYFKHMEMYS